MQNVRIIQGSHYPASAIKTMDALLLTQQCYFGKTSEHFPLTINNLNEFFNNIKIQQTVPHLISSQILKHHSKD